VSRGLEDRASRGLLDVDTHTCRACPIVSPDGAPLALPSRMKRSADYADDMMTLARLHAALDSVVDTEQVMTQIHETSTVPQPTVTRVRELVAEARELLRSLLVRPEARHAVGKSLNPQDATAR
jgi:hypothetical protein